MKILHLFSDNRKTGPAEPAIQMARAMQDRGHEVLFAYRAGGRDGRMPKTVDAYGVPGTTDFALNRYFGIKDTIHDFTKLPRFLKREKFDVIHAHLNHDHILGALCAKRSGRGRAKVIRTLHQRDVIRQTMGYRWMLRKQIDGLLTFTEGFRQAYIEQFGLDPERVGVQGMPVNLEAFDPQRAYKPLRKKIGVPDDAVAIGIVGRFQPYRKMDVFLEGVARVAKQRPNARFVIIGRSRSVEETVLKPIREKGLEGYAIHAGYFTDDYPDAVASLDVFSLLMPGSDGTARAVREGMALGKPCVVSDYGMLPDIVPNDKAGYVVPMDPDALASAWIRLIDDASLRERMGAAARQEAEDRFDTHSGAEKIEAFYDKILGM